MIATINHQVRQQWKRCHRVSDILNIFLCRRWLFVSENLKQRCHRCCFGFYSILYFVVSAFTFHQVWITLLIIWFVGWLLSSRFFDFWFCRCSVDGWHGQEKTKQRQKKLKTQQINTTNHTIPSYHRHLHWHVYATLGSRWRW